MTDGTPAPPSSPDSNDSAGASPVRSSWHPHCPFLGSAQDPGTAIAFPSGGNRCYRLNAPIKIDHTHQQQFCLVNDHVSCPIYQRMPESTTQASGVRAFLQDHARGATLVSLLIVLLLAAAALVWWPGPGLSVLDASVQGAVETTSIPALSDASPLPSPTLRPTRPTVGVAPGQGTTAVAPDASATRPPATPTPQPSPTLPPTATATPTAMATAVPEPTTPAQRPGGSGVVITYATAVPTPADSPTAAPLPSATAPPDGPTATVDTGALNVRSGPGADFETIAVVYRGDVLLLQGRSSDGRWLQIALGDGDRGWVSVPFVHTAADLTALPVTTGAADASGSATAAALIEQGTAVVDAPVLSVRSGPGDDFTRLGLANRGETVQVYGRDGAAAWLLVRLPDGTVGWLPAARLETDLLLDTLPPLR